MALAFSEKLKVVTLLGWPARTLDSTSLSYSNIIAKRFDNLDADSENLILSYIDRVEAMDGRLQGAISRAGVKAIDDIQFFGDSGGSSEFGILRNERKRILVELAGIIDIAIGPSFNGSMMTMGVIV